MLARWKWGKRWLGRTALATVGLAGFLLFGGASNAHARDSYKCQRKIEHAEWKLDEAIERHGYYSRQADHWRGKLAREQERCWREYRGHWGGRYHRWRYDRYRDRDWDD